MEAIRAILRRAHERGELNSDALVRFRNCCRRPASSRSSGAGLFDRFEPLDIRAMMRAYFGVLFGDRSAHECGTRCVARRCAAGACRLRESRRSRIPGLGRGRSDLRQSRRGRPGRNAVGARGRHGREGRAAVHRRSGPAAGRCRDGESVGDQRHPGLRARPDPAQDFGRHAEGGRGRGSHAPHRAGAARLGADPAGAPQGRQAR